MRLIPCINLIVLIVLVSNLQAFGKNNATALNVKIIDERIDEFTIQWKNNVTDISQPVFYKVDLFKDSLFKEKVKGYDNINLGKDTIFTFEHLEGGYTYHFGLSAYSTQDGEIIDSYHGVCRTCENYINVGLHYIDEEDNERIFYIVKKICVVAIIFKWVIILKI